MITFPDKAEGQTFSLKFLEDPPFNATVDALARSHARYDVFGSLAAARTSNVTEFVTTSLVAQDMLAITQAHGFDKLQFYGTSYGSVIGIFIHQHIHLR